MMAGLATAVVWAVLAWYQPRRLNDGAWFYFGKRPSVAKVHRVDKSSPPFGSWRYLAAAAVLVANWLLTHIAWGSFDPVLVHAIADIATAGYFILASQTRWELIIGFLFLASVGVAAATFLDILPDSTERPVGFFVLAHPDLIALLGHAANIVLGFGSGDSGKRLRAASWIKPRLALGVTP